MNIVAWNERGQGMGGGGRDADATRPCTPARPSRDVLDVADQYLARTGGDAKAALVEAVRDGIAVAGSVSRGFVRWGQPASRRPR